MNIHHKRSIKRKVRRQLNKGVTYRNWKLKYKTLLYKWPLLGLCNDIVGIQKMDGPTGKVFKLNFINYELL